MADDTGSRPPRPDPPWEGVVYVAAPDKDWWIVEQRGGARCRFGGGGRGRAPSGPGKPACGKPAVVQENRNPHGGRRAIWSYCDEHMRVRGHWIEFGEVWGWDLQEVVGPHGR